MPVYKSNKDIFKTHSEEVFENRWFDNDVLYVPKTKKWDYKRELKIEDIEVWEVIFEDSWGLGIYAAYEPYAEFYLIRYLSHDGPHAADTFYGSGAQDKIIKFMIEHGIPFQVNDVWVENDEMWLYDSKPDTKKIII
jgi:hypothetical protein